jgi:quercetin dioxygenase-like cupin family protein
MKRLTAFLLALALFVPAGASVAHAGVQAGSGTVTIIRNGSQPSTKGPASCFTGSVRVDPLFSSQTDAASTGDARISVANVTFEPGARTAWHTHPWGQVLVISAGLGRVQAEGSPMQEIRPGDVVWIPAGVRHWHGAAPTTAMTHMSIVVPVNGSSAQWLEKVTDEQYGGE